MATTYGSHPFDAVIDLVGPQDLYAHSPRYLRPDGPYVNIGGVDMAGGVVREMARLVVNMVRPVWLGGVPRRYIFFSNTPDMGELLDLVGMVERGELEVLIDSEFAFEDLMRAYERVTSKRARGKVLIRVAEH